MLEQNGLFMYKLYICRVRPKLSKNSDGNEEEHPYV